MRPETFDRCCWVFAVRRGLEWPPCAAPARSRPCQHQPAGPLFKKCTHHPYWAIVLQELCEMMG